MTMSPNIISVGKDILSILVTFLRVKPLLALKQTCKYMYNYIYNFMELNPSQFIIQLTFASDIMLLTPTYFITPWLTLKQSIMILPRLESHITKHILTIKIINSDRDPAFTHLEISLNFKLDAASLLILKSDYMTFELAPKLIYLQCFGESNMHSKIVNYYGTGISRGPEHEKTEVLIRDEKITNFTSLIEILAYRQGIHYNCRVISLDIDIKMYTGFGQYRFSGVEELHLRGFSDINFFLFMVEMFPTLKTIIFSIYMINKDIPAKSIEILKQNGYSHINVSVQHDGDWLPGHIMRRIE